MSAVEELTVALEHDIDEQYQYQPGEVIGGQVRVKVARPTALRGITIRVVGEGNVSWKDEVGQGGMVQAEEKYVDVSKTILDTKQSEPRNLTPGYHEFPFQYQLPDNLPSSYIGKFGNVTYTMKATVTGVKATDTSITSEPFLVLRHCPLPSSAEQSLVLEQEKLLWGSCNFGKVTARMTLEAQGGVPGEDLFMHAEIRNHSKRTVTAMQAALFMVSSYHAQKQTTYFRQIVSKKRDEFDVGHNEGRRWNYVRLTLPPYIPETRLEHCDIIEVDYIFQFRVEITGGAELKMETPILIGSQLHNQDAHKRRGQPGSGGGGGGNSAYINSHWTVRGAPGVDFTDLERSEVDLGDASNAWRMSTGVPELRGDKVVVNNPLFRHGSFLTKNGGGGFGPDGGGGKTREMKEMPEELMENTRL